MIDKNKFALTAMVGSRLFNLNAIDSDYDYLAIEYKNESKDVIEGRQAKERDGEIDYFITSLDRFNYIEMCASPLIAPSYDSVTGGNSEELKNFWENNCSSLADIWPISTYQSAIEQTEFYLTTEGLEYTYKIAVRLIGMMWCRYYTGDLLSARQLTKEWRDRYFSAKRGELSSTDIMVWLDKIRTPSIRRYFNNEYKNIELHDQFKIIINNVLKEDF